MKINKSPEYDVPQSSMTLGNRKRSQVLSIRSRTNVHSSDSDSNQKGKSGKKNTFVINLENSSKKRKNGKCEYTTKNSK